MNYIASYKDLYPDSRYINAKMVKDRHVSEKQTIGHVYAEEVGKDKDNKLVAYFLTSDEVLGSDKVMVLNKTNCSILEAAKRTEEFDQWTDIQVELMIVRTNKPDGTPTDGIQLKVLDKKK